MITTIDANNNRHPFCRFVVAGPYASLRDDSLWIADTYVEL